MKGLIPRLNIHYSFFDAFVALKSVFDELKTPQNEFFVNHARTGLRIALSALHLPKGSRVAVVSYNCLSVMNAVNAAGHKIVFIDISDDFCIDLSDLEKKYAIGFEAIIVTHLFGIPNNMTEIRRICHSIPIIEDCAHAFLSEFDGRRLGHFSDMAVYSIGQGKFPSIGNGGYLLVNNQQYLNVISGEYQQLTTPSMVAEMTNVFSCLALSVLHKKLIYKYFTKPVLKSSKPNDNKYKNDESKMLKTIFGIYQYKSRFFEQYLSIQQQNAKRIVVALQQYLSDSNFPKIYKTLNFNCFMLPFQIHQRDELINSSKKNGVEIGTHFSRTISWAKEFGYANGSCTNTERIAKEMVVFPCHYNLTDKDILNIINTVKTNKR